MTLHTQTIKQISKKQMISNVVSVSVGALLVGYSMMAMADLYTVTDNTFKRRFSNPTLLELTIFQLTGRVR